MRSPVLEGQPAQGERDILDDQVGFLLRQAQQRHTTIFAAGMIESLTPTQWAALAKLREVGDCSQYRLGRLTAMDAATIKGVVDRLTARGFTMVGRTRATVAGSSSRSRRWVRISTIAPRRSPR